MGGGGFDGRIPKAPKSCQVPLLQVGGPAIPRPPLGLRTGAGARELGRSDDPPVQPGHARVPGVAVGFPLLRLSLKN